MRLIITWKTTLITTRTRTHTHAHTYIHSSKLTHVLTSSITHTLSLTHTLSYKYTHTHTHKEKCVWWEKRCNILCFASDNVWGWLLHLVYSSDEILWWINFRWKPENCFFLSQFNFDLWRIQNRSKSCGEKMKKI